MPEKPKAYTYPVLILSMVLWSLSFVWSQIVYAYLSPVSTIFFRLIIASVFLTGLTLILGKFQKIKKQDILRFVLLAFFEPFLYYLGEGYGIKLTTSTIAAIIVSTIPLFLPFFMYFFTREKISLGSYVGILISFAGVLLIVFNDDFSIKSYWGILYLFLAVASVMGYSYLLNDLAKRYNAYTIISVQNIVGIFYFLPVFLCLDASNISKTIFLDARIMAYICALAIFASSIAFFLYTLAVQQIGITKATIFTYIIPVLTAVFSFILLKETFSARKIAGVMLTISGLFLSQINYANLFSKKNQPAGRSD